MHDLVSNGGGWIWLIAFAGIVCVGAAIVYGSMMWRHRRTDPAIRKVRDEVTREHYRSPEGQKP